MDLLNGIGNFVRIAEAGSFAKAAKALGISSAAVSQNISRLERQLGVRLLARSTRQLSLTLEGEAFLAQCREPLGHIEQACRMMTEGASRAQGLVRVTAVSPVVERYLLPALPQFFARYPGVRLELELSEASTPLVGRRFDVGIRAGLLEDAGFVARPLGLLAMPLVASPAYLLAQGVPSDLAALQAQPKLAMQFAGREQPVPWLLGPAKGQPVRQPLHGAWAPRLACSDFGALLQACERGLGIAQLPMPVALDALRAGRLHVVLAQHAAVRLQLYLHYPSRRQLSARVRAFVEWAVALLADHPDLQQQPAQWSSG